MRKTLVAILILTMFVLASGPAEGAHAATMGGFQFSCEPNFPAWPILGGGGFVCDGEAAGVGVVGDVAINCLPDCTFEAYIDSVNETCVPHPEPSQIGSYSGRMYIDDVFVGTFNWLRFGTEIVFVPPGTLEGRASFIPLPPLGTCTFPYPTDITVVGEVTGAGA